MMQTLEQAIEILRLSRDGAELYPGDLALVQGAVNGRLTEQGEQALDTIYGALRTGDYKSADVGLCGVPHLTRDTQGYVYWKGQAVEHFSHTDPDAMREAALRLAANCALLESKGFPVNSRTAICQAVLNAPADTPWLEALCRYYAFFEKGLAVRGLFFSYGTSPEAVAVEKRAGRLHIERFPDAYEAYHATAAQGYGSAGIRGSYEQIVALLERSTLTPEDIHAALM